VAERTVFQISNGFEPTMWVVRKARGQTGVKKV
jgi:hypothetical protein